ncbi:MAG: AroM family protein [Armatimonadota bacterium]|nr:AroM family protein [Armatimonadota bacterium]MDR7423143.1 AroM family protein [Armatimonadota bacterium]MDR7455034.1 AroM family protein [Armatimonadota bacterium]MDR7457630.1 AroM family protein [Armatimonadota bacterium]MDR7496529.1 AroM family protein [Armatimonadota bacterium]
MDTIAMITVGQAPRDDLVPFMEEVFSRKVAILQAGVLDGHSREAMADLAPDADEVGIVARLQDGSNTLLSHRKILPRVQALVDRVVAAGAELVVILCGADWSALRSPVLIVNPGKVFPAVVSALASGWRLGVIKPSAGQIEQARSQFARRGIDAVVVAASPYTGEQRLRDVRGAAEELRRARVDLVWMTCVGMDEAMRAVVRQVTGKPVILARTILARVIDEFLSAERVPVA